MFNLMCQRLMFDFRHTRLAEVTVHLMVVEKSENVDRSVPDTPAELITSLWR